MAIAKPMGLGADVNLLKIGQAQLEKDVTGMREDIRGLAAAVEKLIDGQRPHWQTYASMGGVMFVLIGALVLPYTSQLSDVKQMLHEHTTGDGHPSLQARTTSNVAALMNLDTKIDTRLNDLEMRTQREMHDLSEALRSEMRTLRWRAKAERLEEYSLQRSRAIKP